MPVPEAFCLFNNLFIYFFFIRNMASCFGAKPESEEDELQDLPDDRENYEYFWKSHSPFSQWHPSKFVVDGKTYNCAEQYMMYHKARTIFFMSQP